MSKIREIRLVSSQGELRADAQKISGYVVRYNDLSEDLGNFRERVAPGAFDESIDGGDEVRMLVEHNAEKLLGRRSSGTLTISSDEVGVRFSVTVPKTTLGADTLEMVRRKDIRGASVGMYVDLDQWDSSKSPAVRTILGARIFDCSLTASPAFPTTSAEVRSILFPDGLPKFTAEPTFGGVPVSQLNDEDFRLHIRMRLAQAEL